MAGIASSPHDPPVPARRGPAPGGVLLVPLLVVVVLLAGGLALQHALPQGGNASAPPGSGPLAPPITATSVDGTPFSLAAQRGKVVVLYSMAAWCTSCVPEATTLGALAAAHPAHLVTVLVDESPQSDTPAAVHAFRLRSEGPRHTWVIDRRGTIARAYGITALDSTIVIDRTGHTAARFGSSLSLQTLQAALRPLL